MSGRLLVRWRTADPVAAIARFRATLDLPTRNAGAALTGPAGRLVFAAGLGADRLEIEAEEAPTGEPGAGSWRPSLVAVGWATVELDRAAEAFLPTRFGPAAPDPHLGAFARRPLLPDDGPAVVLLEPATEGRLAASLVRHGEGPVAIYVAVRSSLDAFADDVRRRGDSTSPAAEGPLGRQVIVLGGPAAGPHLLVVTGGAGTIPS